jgi:hypothetical protein
LNIHEATRVENQKRKKERLFSIELKSKTHLKNITFANESTEGVLIEGVLGELERACFAEGIILEVVGSNGVLRVDLKEHEITRPQSGDEGGRIKQ